MIGIAAEIVELGRHNIVNVPGWTVDYLGDAIHQARKDPRVAESELVIPLLTLNIQTRSPKLEREAQRIINRCYKSAFDDTLDLSKRIENLHTAATCCDYVRRFSIRKAASLWNDFGSQTISQCKKLPDRQISQLLEIAEGCMEYAPICAESKTRLRLLLEGYGKK